MIIVIVLRCCLFLFFLALVMVIAEHLEHFELEELLTLLFAGLEDAFVHFIEEVDEVLVALRTLEIQTEVLSIEVQELSIHDLHVAVSAKRQDGLLEHLKYFMIDAHEFFLNAQLFGLLRRLSNNAVLVSVDQGHDDDYERPEWN